VLATRHQFTDRPTARSPHDRTNRPRCITPIASDRRREPR